MSPESPPAKKPRPRARTPRLPAVASLDVVLVMAFLALTFLLGVFPLKDTDFWWHLRTGDLIRQSGQVPSTDLYTFTAADHPWIDLHWAFQVALSWGYGRGGVVALNLAKCVITCVAVLLLITARRREWPVWVMLLAWLPALLVLGGRMYVRPETLTLLYMAIDLAIVFRWDRSPSLALLLPLVQVAWVNSQGLFVLGPIILAFALIDALLAPGSIAPGRRRWWRIVGLSTFMTGLACLVNPYGIRGALYPLQIAKTMSNPLFGRTIAELMPIPLFIESSAGWHSLPLRLHIATMVLGALSFLIPLVGNVAIRSTRTSRDAGPVKGPSTKASRTEREASKRSRKPSKGGAAVAEPSWRLSPLRLLLFVAFSVLSWRATRNSHQFAAVVGTLTAWNFGEWAAVVRHRSLSGDREERRPRLAPGAFPGLVALACIASVFILVAGGKFYEWAGEGRTIGLGEEPLWFPHAAVKFAGRADMPPRFLSYHDGYAALYDYYHGPGRKVFTDARLEVVGEDVYERYIKLRKQIQDDDPAWTRVLDAYERPAVLVGHANGADLGATILANPGWRCVWFDPIVAVFIHKSYATAVESHGVDLAARHFVPDPSTEPHGIPALVATARALWTYAGVLQSRGRSDLARPLVLLGLDYSRRIQQIDPGDFNGWKLAGVLESSREPIDATHASSPVPRYRLPFDPIHDLSMVRATHALRRALEIAPGDFTTVLLLFKLFEARGMDEAASPLLDRMGRHVPINKDQALFVREASAGAAQLRARLGPGPPSSWDNLSQLEQAVDGLLSRGRTRSAAEFLERAYPDEPRAWDVTDRMATLWLHLGEPARARALWEEAVAPPRPALRSARLAMSHLVEGSFEAARQHYRASLSAEPDLFEAAYGLAVLEQDAGRASAARSAARQALVAAPGAVARSAAQTILNVLRPYGGEDEAPPQSPERRGNGESIRSASRFTESNGAIPGTLPARNSP